jgi:hypothetical protein
MVDQSNSQLIAFHGGRWLRLLHVRNKTRGWLRPGGEFPSQDVQKTAHLGGVWIEEALPVKVPRKWRFPGATLHESLFYSDGSNREELPGIIQRALGHRQ